MLKKLYIFLFTLLSLAACSDDPGIMPVKGLDTDGCIDINFAVAPLTKVSTRSDYDIKKVTMFIFKADGSLVSTSDATLTLADDNKSGTIRLNKELQQQAASLTFYFLANSDYSNPADEDALLGATVTSVYTEINGADYLSMSSKGCKLSDLVNKSVSLMHNAAKVTVTSAKPAADDEAPADAGLPFGVFGTATTGKVMAGGIEDLGTPSAVSAYPADLTANAVTFVHPTKNTGNDEGKSFVIIKAKYNGTDYFYCLGFQQLKEKENEDDAEEAEFIDIAPNHWYEFLVTKVKGPGYSTPEEAHQYPSPMVEYTITDHAPAIYNMISDGVRELGVPHELSPETGETTVDLYVKVYSPFEGEMSADKITLSNIPDWATAGTPTEVTSDASILGSPAYDESDGTPGRVFRIPLTLSSGGTGTISADLTVSWQLLQRTVPLVWERAFVGSELASVNLTIDNGTNNVASGDGETTVSNQEYWSYLNQVYGVRPEDNNGVARNDGLHFPLMYGEGDTKWTYSYKVELNGSIVSGGTPSYKVVGTDAAKYTLTNRGSGSFTITRTDDDWDYIDNSKVEISVDGKKYYLKLYHTGFFHYDNRKHDKDKINGGDHISDWNSNPTYYEVITTSNGDHWLDRNIGATSAGMYVIGEAGSDEAAAGYYLVAGKYVQYGDPEIYSDICPPGYEIPDQTMWDNLRKANGFITDTDTNSFSTYYLTSKGRKVYFPKARYYNDLNYSLLRGEEYAGYYWTRTPATGTEKNEIGNWLKCLLISGSSTSYINGSVEGYGSKYFMQVRAGAKKEGQTTGTMQKTNFLVEGATHVFLYTVGSNNARNPLITWPGRAIGTAETMKEGHLFNYIYESDVNTPDKLYVIFNYVDSKGIIKTYSHDGSGRTQVTTNKDPEDCYGWKVTAASTSNPYNIKPSANTTVQNISFRPADTTGLGNLWSCNDKYKTVYHYERDMNNKLFLVGDAFANVGWSGDKAIEMTAISETLFTWEGEMAAGYFRALTNKSDINKGCYQPNTNGEKVSIVGQATYNMEKEDNDAQKSWHVVVPGRYILTFDTSNNKFYASFLSINEIISDFDSANPINSGKRRIYLLNRAAWGSPYIYTWDTPDNKYSGTWPGSPMSKVTGTSDYLLYFDVGVGAEKVIFTNSGSSPTPTKDISSVSSQLFEN